MKNFTGSNLEVAARTSSCQASLSLGIERIHQVVSAERATFITKINQVGHSTLATKEREGIRDQELPTRITSVPQMQTSTAELATDPEVILNSARKLWLTEQ